MYTDILNTETNNKKRKRYHGKVKTTNVTNRILNT